MLKHVSMEEAVSLLLEQSVVRQTETVSLSESISRVTAEDIFSAADLPPFRKSPFDGYACRASDLPGTLLVRGLSVAGVRQLPTLSPGEAVRIFTGAPLPDAADVIIKQEDVTRTGDEITASMSAYPGMNVIRKGEDVQKGTLLIPAGTRLLPAHLGELAAQGIGSVRVWKKPKAVLIPTGSELCEPGADCPLYGIYNSSSPVLASYMTRMGLDVTRRAIVPDGEAEIFAAVQGALETDADIVFTTGGASVGNFDFAMRTAQLLNAETLFWKVRMKPGGALIVSRVGEKFLIGLSGNPAAALMGLLVILRPLLLKLAGAQDMASWLTLPLQNDMPKKSHAVRLLRGRLAFEESTAYFAEQEGSGNRNLMSFAGCDLIGVVPSEAGPLSRGDTIRALRLPPELC